MHHAVVIDKNKQPRMPCHPARASVPTGQQGATYFGRLAVRVTGSFNITTPSGTTRGIAYRHCRRLHCCDGYTYQFLSRKELAFPPHR